MDTDDDDLSDADDENETKETGEREESDSIHHDLGNFEECEDSHNFAFGFK